MSHAIALPVGANRMLPKTDHERVMDRAEMVFQRLEHELRLLDEIRRTQRLIVSHRRRKDDQ